MGNSEVHLHTPTKFGEDLSKELGQTDKRCSNYSMMYRDHAQCDGTITLCFVTMTISESVISHDYLTIIIGYMISNKQLSYADLYGGKNR